MTGRPKGVPISEQLCQHPTQKKTKRRKEAAISSSLLLEDKEIDCCDMKLDKRISTLEVIRSNQHRTRQRRKKDECQLDCHQNHYETKKMKQKKSQKKQQKLSMKSLLLVALNLQLMILSFAQCDETLPKSVLLDTTEHSALGWTKYPDGGPQSRTPGWVEESFTNFERGINWRSFVVCDVAHNSVNNWLWTPFIERQEASRLYIELKFTMRDCNLFPQLVLSCKETFALLYKESDTPIDPQRFSGNTATPLSSGNSTNTNQDSSSSTTMMMDSFQLLDSIAADEGRFTSNTDVVINVEVRSVPVTKRGIYFAFRDQGACLSLIAIRVYHLKCPQVTANFARFNATPTGRDLSSLVAVEGVCVPNAVQVEQPRMFCSADGSWNAVTTGGQCKCLAGFEPAANGTKCQACPPGKFKPQLGDFACQTCPEHSSILPQHHQQQMGAATECKCHEGFYRSPKDSRSAPCTQPPGPPTNVTAVYVDSSSVVLQWSWPIYTGGRDDLSFKLICDQCDSSSIYSPEFISNFSETRCVVTNLLPNTQYRFLLYSMNGVSHLATTTTMQFSEIQVQTQQAQAQTPANTLSAQGGGFQFTPIYHFRAIPGARGSDMVLAWEAQSWQPAEGLPAAAASIIGETTGGNGGQLEQQLPALYEIRFQPRYLGFGTADTPLSSSARHSAAYPNLALGSSSQQFNSMMDQQQQSVSTTNRAVIVTTLQPRTEYAFQIRAKWSHSNQWTEFSEPIYASTSSRQAAVTNQPASTNINESDFYGAGSSSSSSSLSLFPSSTILSAGQNQQQSGGSSAGSAGSSWFGGGGSFGLFLLCLLAAALVVVFILIQYRKNNCLQSFPGGASGGFGTLIAGGGSTYGGMYGPGASSGLMDGMIGGGPLSFGIGGGGLGSTAAAMIHHPHAHHPTLSASSAGALITGSNASGTSRSSSGGGSSGGGAGNVVQNFIAATLSQIAGHNNHAHHHHHHHGKDNSSHTLAHGGGGEGKLQLFASVNNNGNQNHSAANLMGQQLPLHRNHYHQTLVSGNHLQPHHHHAHPLLQHPTNQQQQHLLPCKNNNNNNNSNDLFKYASATLNQQQHQLQSGAQYMQHQQQDPQSLHIYDDLESTASGAAGLAIGLGLTHNSSGGQIVQKLAQLEIEPQRVRLDSLISRGEFGDLCHASVLSVSSGNCAKQQTNSNQDQSNNQQPSNGSELPVCARLLSPQAGERAKLNLLLEAALMLHFEHPNVLSLRGLVLSNSSSEPTANAASSAMLLAEWTQHGPLDVYLREKKGSLSQLQLISMLRGIALGMQYLAKLNFVHKDLAARNILVNSENVCKITNLAGTGNSTTSTTTTSDNHSHSSSVISTNGQSELIGNNNNNNKTAATSSLLLAQLAPALEQLVAQRLSASDNNTQQQSVPTTTAAAATMHTKLPIKWTALEAIACRSFTSASDVWSFGIVCWEVLSEGEKPYSNWSNHYVINALQAGYRLEQPNNCPDQLYHLMLDCWLKDRVARPTFSQIVKTLDRCLLSADASAYDDPFASCAGQHQMQTNHHQHQHHQVAANNGNLEANQAGQRLTRTTTQTGNMANMQNGTQLVLPTALTRLSNQLSAEPTSAYYESSYNLIATNNTTIGSTSNQSAQLLMNPELEQKLLHNRQQQQQQQQVVVGGADEWLDAINMSRYKENFRSNQISSLQQVATLNQADLALLGIQSQQHVKRLMQAIGSLRNTNSIGQAGEGYLV